MVQAGVRDLTIAFMDDTTAVVTTGFEKLVEQYPDINDTTDQFITRLLDGQMVTEQVRDMSLAHTVTHNPPAESKKYSS